MSQLLPGSPEDFKTPFTTVTRGGTIFKFNEAELYYKIKSLLEGRKNKTSEDLLIFALALSYRHKDSPLGRAIKNRIVIYKAT